MLYLHGMGHFFPENVITNRFLEELDIGTSDSWIMERVGIRERRTVLPLDYIRETRNQDPREAMQAALYATADLAQRAAQMAIERSGLDAARIGMVVSGSCVCDHAIPAEASKIACLLGIKGPAFDLNTACSSFGSHLHFLSMMKEEALPDFVLVVQPEEFTRFLNYNDRKTAVLFGDGAAAAVVSPRIPAKARITLTRYDSDPKGWNKVIIPWYGHFDQDGGAVQMFAIKRTRDLVRRMLEELGAQPQDVSFIGHQANRLMLEAVCSECSIPPSNHFYNVVEYGNSGAAGAPSVLSMNWEKFTRGARVIVALVGSGLSWSGLCIEFDEVRR